jgi:hypothetical protein
VKRQRTDCCKRGHPWQEGSYTWQYGGPGGDYGPYRRCVECNRQRAKRWRKRRMQAALADLALARLRATMQRVRAP